MVSCFNDVRIAVVRLLRIGHMDCDSNSPLSKLSLRVRRFASANSRRRNQEV